MPTINWRNWILAGAAIIAIPLSVLVPVQLVQAQDDVVKPAAVDSVSLERGWGQNTMWSYIENGHIDGPSGEFDYLGRVRNNLGRQILARLNVKVGNQLFTAPKNGKWESVAPSDPTDLFDGENIHLEVMPELAPKSEDIFFADVQLCVQGLGCTEWEKTSVNDLRGTVVDKRPISTYYYSEKCLVDGAAGIDPVNSYYADGVNPLDPNAIPFFGVTLPARKFLSEVTGQKLDLTELVRSSGSNKVWSKFTWEGRMTSVVQIVLENCAPPPPPEEAVCISANVQPSEGLAPLPVTVTVNAEKAHRMKIDWGTGLVQEFDDSIFVATNIYTQTGTFEVITWAQGENGVWKTAPTCEGLVTIGENPPTPESAVCISANVQPSEGLAPLPVTVTVNAEKAHRMKIDWGTGLVQEFGDSIFVATNIYTGIGSFEAIAWVMGQDNEWKTAPACIGTVILREKPQIPDPVCTSASFVALAPVTNNGAPAQVNAIVNNLTVTTTVGLETVNGPIGIPAQSTMIHFTAHPHMQYWITVNGIRQENCTDTFGQLYLPLISNREPPKFGALELTKFVNWVTYTVDTTAVFTLSITGPSFPNGSLQTVDFDGGTVKWENLIPGQYSINEVGVGIQWVAQIISDTLTIIAGTVVNTTVTNNYVPEFCGTAFALDPAKLLLGCFLTPPGFQKLTWTGYTHVSGETGKWLPAITNAKGETLVWVWLEPYKDQTYIKELKIGDQAQPAHVDEINKDFWLYSRLRAFGSAAGGTYNALEVQVYLPKTGATTGLFATWANEVGASSVSSWTEEYAFVAEPQ